MYGVKKDLKRADVGTSGSNRNPDTAIRANISRLFTVSAEDSLDDQHTYVNMMNKTNSA
jgi:hypothetical protein